MHNIENMGGGDINLARKEGRKGGIRGKEWKEMLPSTFHF